MEIMGSPLIDHFDFNYEARVSPYLSVPSSPKRFGEIYMSAPTSPSRISEFYSEFEYFSITSPTPKDDYHDGFAFLVGESEKSPRSAEELFHDGRIKPLKEDNDLLFESAKSPLLSRKHVERSAIEQGKKVIREAFSPRRKNNDNNNNNNNPFGNSNRESEATRGRDKTPSITSSNSNNRHRVARSHSPCREPRYTWVEESQQGSNKEDSNKASLTSSSSKGSRKWRLRDFLLFRSASEGRGSSKDPLRKYPILFKKAEEGKGSSFRSSGSDNPPRPRRKEPLSAHELHYARKKAETEDMKKKTFLPYKQGILGRLAGFTR